MRALLIACASFAVTVSAGCSGDHTGVPAMPSFDPIGTEPTESDGGTSMGGVLQLFCNEGCANIEAACGVRADYCIPGCLANINYVRGCETEELIYLSCLATTHIECNFGYPRTPECDPALQAVGVCQSRPPPGPAFDALTER